LKEYMEGRIPVGTFNKKVFGMMKADRQTMTDLVLNSDRVKIRPGFRELIDYCSRKSFKPIIVSNGLIFYIEAILNRLGVNGIEVHAAENRFSPGGMNVRYVGPDGTEMEVGYKEAYTELLQKRGYNVIYVGNGTSDIYPSRQARYVFATADLLERCREENLECTPFTDFYDVIRGLENLSPG
ncbi:MAG TPA: haloacid dehalogenase-like hydrolase, partial [Dehalococcoidales bacterium]|nr:haloacid dehalogenase-like hydrolase [Dehalococcoidales bacterium]